MLRTDTRRYRKVNPLGPNPEEQAKVIGSKTSYQRFDYNGPQSRARLREALDDPDMTPIPRRDDTTVRLYLRGRTVTVPEVIGDEEDGG